MTSSSDLLGRAYLPNGCTTGALSNFVQLTNRGIDVVYGQGGNIYPGTVLHQCLAHTSVVLPLLPDNLPHLCNHKTDTTAPSCHQRYSALHGEQVSCGECIHIGCLQSGSVLSVSPGTRWKLHMLFEGFGTEVIDLSRSRISPCVFNSAALRSAFRSLESYICNGSRPIHCAW